MIRPALPHWTGVRVGLLCVAVFGSVCAAAQQMDRPATLASPGSVDDAREAAEAWVRAFLPETRVQTWPNPAFGGDVELYRFADSYVGPPPLDGTYSLDRDRVVIVNRGPKAWSHLRLHVTAYVPEGTARVRSEPIAIPADGEPLYPGAVVTMLVPASANVFVEGLPYVVADPVDTVGFQGYTARFSVATAPSRDVRIQWQSDALGYWADLDPRENPSATTDALGIEVGTYRDSARYRAVVRCPRTATASIAELVAWGCVSKPAGLAMLGPPAFEAQPEPVHALPGTDVALRAPLSDATYGANLEWQRAPVAELGSFAAIDETGETLRFAEVAESDEGYYRCVAVNPAGRRVSRPVLLEVADGPVVLREPEDVEAIAGAPVRFSVEVAGDGIGCVWEAASSREGPWAPLPATYQSESIVLGQGQFRVETGFADGDSAGSHYVRARLFRIGDAQADSADGEAVASTVFSRPARHRLQRLALWQSPQPVIATPGQAASLSVSPLGVGPFHFQWYRGHTALRDDGIGIFGARTSTLVLAAGVEESDEGPYAVRVFDALGHARLSKIAPVVVEDPPVFAQQPTDLEVAAGQVAELEAQVESATAIEFQWERYHPLKQCFVALPEDRGRTSGARSPRYRMAPLVSHDAGRYRLVASNRAGTRHSRAVSIRIGVPLAIEPIVGPSAVYADAKAVSLQATIAGGGGTRYAVWFADGRVVDSPLPLPAGTANTQKVLAVPAPKASQTYAVRAWTEDAVVETPPFDVAVFEPLRVRSLRVEGEGSAGHVVRVRGETMVLQAEVSGGIPPLTYTWMRAAATGPRNPTAFAVSSRPIFPVSNLHASDSGRYGVVVTDSGPKNAGGPRIESSPAIELQVEAGLPAASDRGLLALAIAVVGFGCFAGRRAVLQRQ